MRYFRRGPLVIMLAVTLFLYGIVTGVPKILELWETQRMKKEYHVEALEEYLPREESFVSGNGVSGNEVSGNDVSGNAVSGNDVSGGNVGQDSVSENEVSGNQVSGNDRTDDPASGQVTYTQVGEEYFEDALFIGDSRTVGLYEYSGMEQAAFYASTGLTVYKVFDAEIVPVPGTKNKITIEEALQKRQFGKIYFMIGINEMGRGTVDSFMEEYEAVVAHLQELQPNAVIYVQAIMRVSKERSDKGDYINNEGINARNVRIAKLADNEKIFYLDVNPYVCDETGGLNASYTFDGVHLKAEYIPIWTDFLKSHAVVW